MATEVWFARTWALLLLGFLTLITAELEIVKGRKVMLLDTTKLEKLNWTTYQVAASGNKGWNELTVNDQYGSPKPVYSSCYVTVAGVDNWLRTPFIPRHDANNLHIEIEFTMRRCIKHDDPTTIQQCKETFNLYYYEAESDIANNMMPTWDNTAYTRIDKIAADNLFTDSADQTGNLNIETRRVELRKGLRGVYFAVQDTGACIVVTSIKVYYIMCPNITRNYAFFSEMPTGVIVTDPVMMEGRCVANAAQTQQPQNLCTGLGSWTVATPGNCKCQPGFEGKDGLRCVPCQVQHYKDTLGNEACARCPAYSYTDRVQSTECRCDVNYYRSKDDPKDMPCTQPPSAPRNLTVAFVTEKMVRLTWLPPSDNGGRTDLHYRVKCTLCGQEVHYNPGQRDFNNTSVTMSYLRPSTTYEIFIYAENGVSVTSPQVYNEMIRVTTDMAFPTISQVRVIMVGASSITIAWELPGGSQANVGVYRVKYYPKHQPRDVKNLETSMQNLTLKELTLETEYSIQVCGKTAKGWGEYSEPIFVKTGYNGEVDSEPQEAPIPSVGIMAGAIVAVILCMVIATIMIIILVRRNRNNTSETKNEFDAPHYSHVVSCPPMEPPINGGLTIPLFQPTGGSKTYVDPHTYEDPNQAVREFTREIDASHITIESVIGGGEFGDVCKGKLRINGRPEMTVAIKTLKPGATDKNRLDFLTEASIMGQFDDPNVIFLEGVVTKSHPIMIVTEYMADGSLDTFLRNNDGKFTIIQLIGMMRGIASGMRYLSEMGYVHRDLAARNILINENLVCKVADFGLSREIDIDTTEGAYTTKGGKIPVRWTAPEAIAFRKFTSQSDVWSFGVVKWEIVSYGERPYWNWSNQDVIRAVEKGYRLPPPMDCPEAIHQLMLDTWQKDRNNRPKFAQIVRQLDKLIRAPELLRKIAKPRPFHFIDTCPTITQVSSIDDWLISIKMERYISNFIQAGYTNMEQVIRISVKDLETLGVTLVGHQKKFMNSVQTLRAQIIGAQMSEGFLV